MSINSYYIRLQKWSSTVLIKLKHIPSQRSDGWVFNELTGQYWPYRGHHRNRYRTAYIPHYHRETKLNNVFHVPNIWTPFKAWRALREIDHLNKVKPIINQSTNQSINQPFNQSITSYLVDCVSNGMDHLCPDGVRVCHRIRKELEHAIHKVTEKKKQEHMISKACDFQHADWYNSRQGRMLVFKLNLSLHIAFTSHLATADKVIITNNNYHINKLTTIIT